MGKGCSRQIRNLLRASLVAILLLTLVFGATFQGIVPHLLTYVRAQAPSGSASIAPTTNWGPLFGTSGDVQIDINRPGIAVRVEIPREFLQGVISKENDTSFIQSDIRNDYYYYNVVDESDHWTYSWHGAPSDGACYKPNFSLRDPNAPWCVEIWNYLNGKFLNFTAPKFIRFQNLNAPSVAGVYNFTLFVANRTNSIGYPDFVRAWNTTLFVPVSMSDDPATISGFICDADVPLCPVILHDKGFVLARNIFTGMLARAFVNQTTGSFSVTGLAPGRYVLQASAGVLNGVAYSLSAQSSSIDVVNGDNRFFGAIHLHRAPQVCGDIVYESAPGAPLAQSFSDHPYLKNVLGSPADLRFNPKLSITVEATDTQSHVFRYRQILTNDAGSNSFRIITGSNVTFVGTDPYGTEFAGLPAATGGFSSYLLALQVWMTGYVQAFSETVKVSSAPGFGLPVSCNQVAPNPVIMRVGGVITGTIQLRNLVALETPNEAMLSLGISSPEPLFGGNILIQAYDHHGILRGVMVNGTIPELTGDVDSLRFYVIGFSEYSNHTWSGVWNEKDYGLPADQAYSLKVFIRGYEQASMSAVTVSQGGNSTITVRMIRGGLFQVTVTSFNNRFGMRVEQTKQPFKFANLRIPVRARVYFYDSSGRIVGYVERLVKTGGLSGVGNNSFTVLFAGQNWSLREIWFYGFVPSHITNDTYSINAYTLGYVQLRPVLEPNDLTGFQRAAVTLLIANNIGITAPIYADPSLLSNTREHEHAIGEASNNAGLAGALPANLSAFVPTLSLPISGFGAMINITCNSLLQCNSDLLGQGHFFYVAPDGTRYFDYGLDTGYYTAEVPEFGFNFHLTQTVSPVPVTFTDLSQGDGVGITLLTMAMIVVHEGAFSVVTGWVRSQGNTNIPLSWVQVQASSATFTRSVGTLDGTYDGAGALFLTEGVYSVTFSNPFFKSQTTSSISVSWGQSYNVLPPDGPLCPTGGISGTCDP